MYGVGTEPQFSNYDDNERNRYETVDSPRQVQGDEQKAYVFFFFEPYFGNQQQLNATKKTKQQK